MFCYLSSQLGLSRERLSELASIPANDIAELESGERDHSRDTRYGCQAPADAYKKAFSKTGGDYIR